MNCIKFVNDFQSSNSCWRSKLISDHYNATFLTNYKLLLQSLANFKKASQEQMRDSILISSWKKKNFFAVFAIYLYRYSTRKSKLK